MLIYFLETRGAFMKILFLCSILLFALISPSWAQDEVQDDFAARPIEELEELFQQKQYQIVIDECERLIAYDPWRWEAKWARLKLSECYAALGQTEKAQAIMAEAEASISHPEERAEILLWQLRHAIEKGNMERAYELAETLSTKFIGDYHALETMEIVIEADLEGGRLEEAGRRIDQMIQQYPFQENSLWLAMRLGEGYREREQPQQAIEIFQKIQKIHPHRIEVFGQLAETYRGIGDLDAAIKACDAAVAIFPGHWNIVHLLSIKGEILKEKGDLASAIEAYLIAGEFRGTDQGRHAIRRAAECYHELGKTDQAIELLTKLAHQGYPDAFTVEALATLARVYEENFDYVRAESIFKEIAENFPQTRFANEAMMHLLEVYWRINQREKAIDLLISLIASPNPYLSRQVIHRLIELSHEEGVIAELEARQKLPEIAKLLRQATDSAPNQYAALAPLQGLAVIAQWGENWDEAIEINTRLIKDYDDLLITLETRERLAECYRAKGELDKALEQVNQIIAVAPEGPRAPSAMLRAAHYHLAQELRQSGALKLLRELADKYPKSEEGHEAREMLERFGDN